AHRSRGLRCRNHCPAGASQCRTLPRAAESDDPMSSPWIAGLRSVALYVPDLAKAEAFYTQTWHLEVAHREDGALYLRGSGSDHHLLALHQGGEAPQIRQVTLRARNRAALDAVLANVVKAGGKILAEAHELTRNPA